MHPEYFCWVVSRSVWSRRITWSLFVTCHTHIYNFFAYVYNYFLRNDQLLNKSLSKWPRLTEVKWNAEHQMQHANNWIWILRVPVLTTLLSATEAKDIKMNKKLILLCNIFFY